MPALFAAQQLKPGAHTLFFLLSVLAIVPLAALLSKATESVAAKTGDTVGGLLNATLGNLAELVIALQPCAPENICWLRRPSPALPWGPANYSSPKRIPCAKGRSFDQLMVFVWRRI